MTTNVTPANRAGAISLADEEAVKDVLVNTVFDL